MQVEQIAGQLSLRGRAEAGHAQKLYKLWLFSGRIPPNLIVIVRGNNVLNVVLGYLKPQRQQLPTKSFWLCSDSLPMFVMTS